MASQRYSTGSLKPARRRRADRARQVADVLRHQVLAGSFRFGQLPREAQLCGDFGVSRNTVREALALLADEGLVERSPGIGTTVLTEKYAHGLHRLMGLGETPHAQGEITNDVRTAVLARPPAMVAQRLGVPYDEPVVYLERLRRLDGVPLSLDLTYLPRDIGEPLLAEDLAGQDIFADPDPAVRLHATRGLVRLNDVSGLAAAATDVTREVRVAVAHGVGTVGDAGGAAVLHRLAGDPDPLVRAAALQAAGQIGCPGELATAAVAALADPAWQAREGAAKALGGADPDIAVAALTGAAHDPNLDVRRAAVRSLSGWVHRADVVVVLESAAADHDADVRAYARRALAPGTAQSDSDQLPCHHAATGVVRPR